MRAKINDFSIELTGDPEEAQALKERTISRLFFPTDDVVGFLSLALAKAATLARERGDMPDLESMEPPPLSEVIVPMPTALYDRLVEAVNVVEAEFIAKNGDTQEKCDACRAEAKALGLKHSICPGIHRPGDLMQNIVGAALRIGMAAVLEQAMVQIYGSVPQVKKSSVEEFFGPALKTITARP